MFCGIPNKADGSGDQESGLHVSVGPRIMNLEASEMVGKREPQEYAPDLSVSAKAM